MSEETAEDAQRRAQATAMRLAGAEYAKIARALGYADEDACRADVAGELEHRVRDFEDVSVEVARLDRLQQGLWSSAIQGDTRAAGLVSRIIDRRIQLTRPRTRVLPHHYEPGCEPE